LGEQGRPRKGVGFYFAGGHSEKGRYLLLKSLSGEMANVPLILILKTCKARTFLVLKL